MKKVTDLLNFKMVTCDSLPDNYLVFKTDKYCYIFGQGIEITLELKKITLEKYLNLLFKGKK